MLQQSIRRAQKDLNGLDGEVKQEEEIRAQRLADSEEQIAAKEQRLVELNAKLEAIRSGITV